MDETVETTTIKRNAVLTPARWAWTRQWEFWLVVALGAFLRLWQINLTQYLDDQTLLMRLARAAVTRGLIPLTGIPSSIHTLNPPLSVYLLIPSALLTANPLPNAVIIALWNILGVALCYIFTLRYFGRKTAFYGTALFATCGAAINYSRFIWQQNYLPPLFILWALTLYAGCVERKQRWFVANVTLLALATLLHPIAAFLAPVTLVGALLAPRFPRWRSWLTAALICLVLIAPTLLWEALSHFSDVSAFRQYATSSHFNAQVFRFLYAAIGGPDAGSATTALNIVATLLFALGWVALTIRTVAPMRSLPWSRDNGLVGAVRVWLVALYRGLRASAPWKINLLLWLSVTLPILLMIRNNGALFAHYLMVLYPTAFIASGIGVVDVIEWVRRRGRSFAAGGARALAWGGLALEALLALVLLGRSVQWLSYPASLTDAATFSAYGVNDTGYGYPLSVLEDGANQLDALQQQTGAALVETLAPNAPRFSDPANYILAGERTDRLAMSADCVVLPSASATDPWLITSTQANSPASDLLASLTGASQAGKLTMVGGPAYPVYAVSGGASLPETTPFTPVTYDDGQGDTLQLTALLPLSDGALAAGWKIIKTAPTMELQSRYFTVSLSAPNGPITTTCQAQRWDPGATLYTALSASSADASAALSVTTGTSGLDVRTIGNLGFVSDFASGEAPVALRPRSA